jgi:hypothetical protein
MASNASALLAISLFEGTQRLLSCHLGITSENKNMG